MSVSLGRVRKVAHVKGVTAPVVVRPVEGNTFQKVSLRTVTLLFGIIEGGPIFLAGPTLAAANGRKPV